jgi:hypothetical protein
LDLSGLGFINACILPLLLLNKNRSNMEMVQLQWNFASAKEILHIFLHFFIGLFGLIFFRAKSITDAVLYIKRILQTEVSAQYLSNERYNYELLNDRVLLWSNGIVDLKKNHFLEKQLVESSCSNCGYSSLRNLL